MAVTIDSLVPNSVCLDEYQPVVPGNHPKPASKSASPCVIEAVLRVTENASEHRIQFQRGESGFILAPALNNPSITGLVQRAGFNPQAPFVQGALNQSIGLKWFWSRNYANYMNPKEKGSGAPIAIPDAANFLQSLQDFIHLEYTPQDAVQKARLGRLLSTLLASPDPVQSFVADNLKLLLAPDVANRFTLETLQRERALLAILDFSKNSKARFSFVKGHVEFEKRLAQNIQAIAGYLLMGTPEIKELSGQTRSLAFEADGMSADLFGLYQQEMEALKASALLQIDPATAPRLEALSLWLQQPTRQRELEYSRLKPEEALRKSIEDHLLSQDPAKLLTPYATAVLGAQNFSADWFNDEAKLRRIMSVIFENVKVLPDEKGKPQIDPEKFRLLAFQVETNMEAEVNERREFAAGYLAVLTYYFGDPPQALVKWNVFREGRLAEVEIPLNEEHQKTLRAVYAALKARLKASVFHTETNLPLLEGSLCLLGTGVAIWGALDERDRINAKTYAGSAMAGAGCASLITHYTISQGQPDLYWRDLIGGGVGLALGLGIPFLLDLDGGDSKTSGAKPIPPKPPGDLHYDFPPIQPLPNPIPPPQLPPFRRPPPAPNPDGRNPSDGFGP